MYREVIFVVFNLIWVIIFLEVWKRYCFELFYRWGIIDMVFFIYDEFRVNYFGIFGENLVIGKLESVFLKWKRSFRFYCVTVLIVFVVFGIVFYIMLGYFVM